MNMALSPFRDTEFEKKRVYLRRPVPWDSRKKGVEGCWLELQVDDNDDAVTELARKYAKLEHDAKKHRPPQPPAATRSRTALKSAKMEKMCRYHVISMDFWNRHRDFAVDNIRWQAASR